MYLYEVIKRPLITEKNSGLQTQGKFAFEVAPKATKPQVKQAVEQGFKVSVTAVNMMNMPGKMKRFGKRIVKTPSWKKAVVTLKAGEKIEIFEGV